MYALKPRRPNLTKGIPMHEALTPAQCAEMRTFLRTLVHYGRTVRHVNQRGITDFLKEYVRLETGREWSKNALRNKRRKRMGVKP